MEDGSIVRQSALCNRLLSRLPEEDYQLIGNALEPISFSLSTSFAEPGQTITSVFFLESGIASIVVRSPEGQLVEGGIIGREGYVAPAAVLGSDQTPHLIRAQLEGAGYRINRDELIGAMNRSPSVREALLRFAHVNSVQATYTLLSNAVHQVDERLARWLLMCHDRTDSDDLHLTHDFMSLMLAVRRPSVTNALHVLEGNGFIHSERGYVLITNRRAMEDFAGDAYGKPEAEYERLLGSLR